MIKGIKTHSVGPAEYMGPPPHPLTFGKCINPISNQGGGGQIMRIIWALGFYQFFHQEYETLKKLCEFSTVWADRSIFGSTENVCNFAKDLWVFSCFHGQKSRILWPGHVLFCPAAHCAIMPIDSGV